MTWYDRELLQVLHSLILLDKWFLTEEQYDIYNKLADEADKQNIIW